MAINALTATSVTATSGTTLMVNKPSGVVAGSLLLAAVYVQASSIPTITPPSGWTSLGTVSSGSQRAQVFYLVAGASEPTNYTFTSSLTIVAGTAVLEGYTFTGTGVVGASAFGSQAVGAVVIAPTVTVALPNSLLYCAFFTVTLGTGVTGMTTRAAVENGNRDVAVFDQAVGAGATGTRTYTGSSTGWGFSLSIEELAANRIRMMI